MISASTGGMAGRLFRARCQAKSPRRARTGDAHHREESACRFTAYRLGNPTVAAAELPKFATLLWLQNHAEPDSPLALILPIDRPCRATVGHPHGPKEGTGVSHGDQASCSVVRARADRSDACGLRRAHCGRATDTAGREPAGVPGAGGAARGIG